MKFLNVFFGLVLVCLFVSSASAQLCCGWNPLIRECSGFCGVVGEFCTQVGFNFSSDEGVCDCIPEGACSWVGGAVPIVPGVGLCAGSCPEDFFCNVSFDVPMTALCVCEPEPPVDVCRWNTSLEMCVGPCEGGLVCTELSFGVCDCVEPPLGCGDCCRLHGFSGGSCSAESCPAGSVNISECDGVCVEGVCCCSVPPVPEFLTPAVALAVLLASPAFAYLFVRRLC